MPELMTYQGPYHAPLQGDVLHGLQFRPVVLINLASRLADDMAILDVNDGCLLTRALRS